MNLKRRHFLMASAALLAAPAFAQSAAPRTVVLGGSLAEIVVALGAEAQLVGRDSTASFPESILTLPDVGYLRALSPEGVLSLTPELIIAEADAGPPPVVDVLKSAGVRFETIDAATNGAGVVEKITKTAAVLGVDGTALAAQVQGELDAAAAKAASVTQPVSVMFVLSLQGGKVMSGGAGSSAEGIITMAGGKNAATGFDGYKPMTDEAVLAAAPDVILVMDREGDLAITPDQIKAHPALGQTPAAQAGRVVAMDGLLLLGFGPRTGQAALQLHDALYSAGK